MRTPSSARRHAARTSALASLSIIAGLSLLSGPGCASSPRPIYTTDAPYAGPPMAAAAGAGQHVIAMTAPTSGWALTLDRTRRAMGRMEVFVTATPPNPAVMTTPATVVHEVGSTVQTSIPIDVYARILPFTEQAEDQPYRFVMGVPGIPQTPPSH